MAIKDSAEGWVRGKPVLAMVVVALIGAVVGGVIGLGVGFKVEQSRTRDDVKRLQQQIKSSGAANPNGPLEPARRRSDRFERGSPQREDEAPGRAADHHDRHDAVREDRGGQGRPTSRSGAGCSSRPADGK